MTIKSSGTLGMSDISAEFGGTGARALSQYYRGGGRVPGGLVAIPASGTISLSQFYSQSNVTPGVSLYYASQGFIVPTYTTLTVTVEGINGAKGATGATGAQGPGQGVSGSDISGTNPCGNGGPGGPGGAGGSGGIGGKATKTWTYGVTAGFPTTGANVSLVFDGTSVRFLSSTPVVAFPGGTGGTGGSGGPGGIGGAQQSGGYSQNYGGLYTCGPQGSQGSTGSTGSVGAPGSASGGDTNTSGASGYPAGRISISWS